MSAIVNLAHWGFELNGPCTSKTKARTRFRYIWARTYPHVAEYYISHFFTIQHPVANLPLYLLTHHFTPNKFSVNGVVGEEIKEAT